MPRRLTVTHRASVCMTASMSMAIELSVPLTGGSGCRYGSRWAMLAVVVGGGVDGVLVGGGGGFDRDLSTWVIVWLI